VRETTAIRQSCRRLRFICSQFSDVTAAFCNDPAAAILTFFEELAVAGATENSNGRNQRGIYSAQTRVSAEDKFGNTTYRHELILCYSHVVP
jgi:hypothetical protein